MTHILKIIGSLLLVLALGCSVKPIGTKSKGSDKSGEEKASSDDAGDSLDAPIDADEKAVIESFAGTLHPLLIENCGACHGESKVAAPSLALASPVAAYSEITTAKKVDRANPSTSRIVVRLRDENHNCWGECSENGQEVEDAINAWVELVGSGDGGEGDGYVPEGEFTEELPIKAIKAKPVNPNPDGVYGFQAENGDLDLFLTNGSTVAAGGKFISTDFVDGKGVPSYDNNNPSQAFLDQDVASVSIPFWVEKAGTHTVFVRYKAINNNQNSVYMRMNGGDTSKEDFTSGADWQWRRTNTEWELKAGKNLLEVRERESGMKIDMVVISSDFDVDLDAVVDTPMIASTFEYDLSAITGVEGIKLSVKVEEFNDISYLLTGLTIHTAGKAASVKEIHIMLNGKSLPIHATFKTVDLEIPKGLEEAELSSAAAIVLKDEGIDKDVLSFAFGELEIVQ